MLIHILCVSLFAMVNCDFFPDIKGNLTKITWAHAVNNQTLLKTALENDVMMLEADVSYDETDKIPIMAHSADDKSDLSLKQFLDQVNEHNSNDTIKNHKGIKLDFKSMPAFDASLDMLKELTKKAQYPIWVNADILRGPVNATREPLNANEFLTKSNQIPNVTLSIGWTTFLNSSLANNSYSDTEIDQMLSLLKPINITHPITFPMRAGLAAESLPNMRKLIDNITDSTLTLWSSEGDPVNIDNLQKLIFDIGLDKVYIDVPEDLMEKLHLKSSSNRAGNIGIVSVLFSTIIMLATSKLL